MAAAVGTPKTQSEVTEKSSDLSRRMLLSAEALRISQILENCMCHMETVSTLLAKPHVKGAAGLVDENLRGALQKHHALAAKFQREMFDGAEVGAEGDDGGAKAKARARLKNDIQDSVRDVLRILRTCPDASSGSRPDAGVKLGVAEQELFEGLRRFHNQMVDKLLTSVDAELQLVLYKPPPSAVHKLVHMAPIEEEVNAAIKEMDAKIAKKKADIENLEMSLDPADSQTVCTPLTEKKCEPKVSEKVASMQQEVDQLRNQLYNLILENKQAERVLEEKNEKVEVEIEYLLETFDCEMEEKQVGLELNEIDNEHTEVEMNALLEPYSILEKDYELIHQKRRVAEMKREKELQELEHMTKNALIIQAYWKGYTTRKVLKSMKKSAGKGKGKKGKGKKK